MVYPDCILLCSCSRLGKVIKVVIVKEVKNVYKLKIHIQPLQHLKPLQPLLTYLYLIL